MLQSLTTSSYKAKDAFTKREKQVIKFILEERTSAEIGEILGISRRTVEVYRKNIIAKLGVRNTVGIVKFAMKHGMN
ncbi:MAG: hypothetical protein C0594_17065 [Marinilabiliales bacterium]|nr:MAG: hypothetical protein C0594_17065 [Marinilabiliales bacterium]